MLTYEYRCEKCERTFEVEQKISDPPLKHCPLPSVQPHSECGGDVKRLIAGQTSFVLNGKGWFRDGY